jgi:hypothetical protein
MPRDDLMSMLPFFFPRRCEVEASTIDVGFRIDFT